MEKVIAVINGPNLNLLGSREPEIYGSQTLEGLLEGLVKEAAGQGYDIWSYQSNSEGELVDAVQAVMTAPNKRIQQNISALIINPAAYSHTSIALRDAIAVLSLPVIEVHISNVFSRESFRHHSHITAVVDGLICGLGTQGYRLALRALIEQLENKKT
ncbi:MAG: type II 3-dehydroquinate dehydratase [Deltaproteobacteria bacterium]|nr:type II 3-dehydroquinate dehydratase [Deltaproteobacteria bacterium]